MVVRVGIGLFTGQVPAGSPRSFAQEYRETLELVRLAEALGFDSAWVSEHHGSSDGYLPSLMVMLGAFADATSHIRLGTGVVLTPFHDPIRLAEDAAVVDQLSDGRLTLGLGIGWREEEFRMFGVPIAGTGPAPGRYRRDPAARLDGRALLLRGRGALLRPGARDAAARTSRWSADPAGRLRRRRHASRRPDRRRAHHRRRRCRPGAARRLVDGRRCEGGRARSLRVPPGPDGQRLRRRRRGTGVGPGPERGAPSARRVRGLGRRPRHPGARFPGDRRRPTNTPPVAAPRPARPRTSSTRCDRWLPPTGRARSST